MEIMLRYRRPEYKNEMMLSNDHNWLNKQNCEINEIGKIILYTRNIKSLILLICIFMRIIYL